MAFCPRCGKQMSDDANFCPSCGATVTPASPGAAGPTPPPPVPPPGTPPSPPTAGAPPAHVPGAVPPPPRKQKTGSGWKIALVVILIVLLFAGAVLAVLAVFVFKTVKAPVDVTNRYIEAMNEGDAEEAWSLLHPSSPIRREYTFSSFDTDFVQPATHSLSDWNAYHVEVSGSNALVKVEMKFTDGTDYETTFELSKSDGDWLIYNHTLAYQ